MKKVTCDMCGSTIQPTKNSFQQDENNTITFNEVGQFAKTKDFCDTCFCIVGDFITDWGQLNGKDKD